MLTISVKYGIVNVWGKLFIYYRFVLHTYFLKKGELDMNIKSKIKIESGFRYGDNVIPIFIKKTLLFRHKS